MRRNICARKKRVTVRSREFYGIQQEKNGGSGHRGSHGARRARGLRPRVHRCPKGLSRRSFAEVDITKSEAFAAGRRIRRLCRRDRALRESSSATSCRKLHERGLSLRRVLRLFSYADAYELIKDSLVNRAIYLQYAQGHTSSKSGDYTVAGYEAAVNAAASEGEKDIAGLALLPRRRGAARWRSTKLKVAFNSAIDSLETCHHRL